MFTNSMVGLSLALVLATVAAQPSTQTDSTAVIPDPKLDALATMARVLTDQGLFAEEYDEILEAAQNEPQLFGRIIQSITGSAK
jgi:hypothetical protein